VGEFRQDQGDLWVGGRSATLPSHIDTNWQLTAASASTYLTPLPEQGAGTRTAVEALLRIGTATATASAGPRFYQFVIGGSTPAALAADWIVSMLDQNAFVSASSRLADAAETVRGAAPSVRAIGGRISPMEFGSGMLCRAAVVL
jgi:hypothetical protein